MFESSQKLLQQKLSLFFTYWFQKRNHFNLLWMLNITYCLLTETKWRWKKKRKKLEPHNGLDLYVTLIWPWTVVKEQLYVLYCDINVNHLDPCNNEFWFLCVQFCCIHTILCSYIYIWWPLCDPRHDLDDLCTIPGLGDICGVQCL